MSFLDRFRRNPRPSAAAGSELACQELVELITDYLERSLTRADDARFEEHLKGCQNCGIYLEQMRQVIRTMGRLSEETIDASARDALLLAFRDRKAG
jgi:predicted anti-sigma-YlaC factor YlaD